jgi:hypothetical protein
LLLLSVLDEGCFIEHDHKIDDDERCPEKKIEDCFRICTSSGGSAHFHIRSGNHPIFWYNFIFEFDLFMVMKIA